MRSPAFIVLPRLCHASHLLLILPDVLGLGSGALSGSERAQKNTGSGRGGCEIGGGGQFDSAHGVVLLMSVLHSGSSVEKTAPNAN